MQFFELQNMGVYSRMLHKISHTDHNRSVLPLYRVFLVCKVIKRWKSRAPWFKSWRLNGAEVSSNSMFMPSYFREPSPAWDASG